MMQRALPTAAAACLLAAAPSPAQPDPLWIVQFGTGGDDEVSALAPDGAGGVFVGGRTTGALGGSNLGGPDAFVGRFDSAGRRRWLHQFGTDAADRAAGIAPDGAGGVWVAGETWGDLGGASAGGSDVFLTRYDGGGAPALARQFGTNANDWPHAAAADGSGGLYIAGGTRGRLGGAHRGDIDPFLARYDSRGTRLWTRQFGTPARDRALSVATDTAGAWVVGETWADLGGANAGGSDVFIARLDGAGDRLWTRQLGTTANDWANAVAPDGAGGAYVAGGTRSNLGGPYSGGVDAWVARFDASGSMLWIRQFGTEADDVARSIAGAAGGVFVAGYTGGSLDGDHRGGSDAWLAKLDEDGGRVWLHQFGSERDDRAVAVVVDSERVFVGGWTSGALGGPNAGGRDAWVAGFPAD